MGGIDAFEKPNYGGRPPGKIEASLNEKLQNVKWGEYRLGDLFEVKIAKSADRNKLTFDQCGKYDFVGRSNIDNGVQGKINKLKYEPNPKGTFSLVQVGESVCLYRINEWYASQNIFILIPILQEFSETYHFVSSCINKALWKYKEAYVYPTLAEVKNIKMYLPNKNGKIDFDFMESFIAELEAQLSVAGLKDTHLSFEEEQALMALKNDEIVFKDFTYKSIFNHIKQGRRLKKDDQLPGNIPFVMAGVTNTGIANYISNPVTSFSDNAITIDIFGNTFYRSYNFGAGDDTGVYWNDIRQYSKNQMLFFTGSMGKSLKNRFSYGKKLRSSQSYDFTMKLPVKNNEIDFEFMDTFISAIIKLTIKDVVVYADRKIEATKDVVGKRE